MTVNTWWWALVPTTRRARTLRGNVGALGGVSKMKTAIDYRAMAEECFQWAIETHDRVRAGYLGLAQVWLDAATKLDGLPAAPIAPDRKACPDTR